MSHAAIITLIHNESFVPKFNSTEMFENFKIITDNGQKVGLYLYALLLKFLHDIAVKYTETFGDNHWPAIVLFVIILNSVIQIITIKSYSDHLKELEDQSQYLKNKFRILEGNTEFVLEHAARNELKLLKLTKHMKKLQKEVNEYM